MSRLTKYNTLCEYELYRLVVSLNHHDGDLGLHKAWGDHVNVADLCVVWRDSAGSQYLSDFDFWNGEFTCFVQPASREAWASFNPEQLSSNHLISDNERI